MPPEHFHLAAVNDAVAGTAFEGHLHHSAVVSSTSDLALQAALAGARVGVWFADRQITGRGRGSHAWHSPAGDGLYMTTLVAPVIPTQSALQLSFRAAIAVQSAIAQVTGLRIREQIDIRWPNDLMVARATGPQRKVGGILIDTASNPAAFPQPAMLRSALIGIGISVTQTSFPPDLEATATSLCRELPDHPPLRREPLASAILNALDAEIKAVAASDSKPATCNCLNPAGCSTWIEGKPVRVEPRADGSGGYTGKTAGLDAQGFLLVQGDDGQFHTVLSGGLREL